MVYLALAGAVGSGSPAGGALFMALFGLATIPVMGLVSLAPAWRRLGRYSHRLRLLVPIVALLFILRGLNLGIPYISPQFTEGLPPHRAKCH
jgi:sulfite exporter TauE/SafE